MVNNTNFRVPCQTSGIELKANLSSWVPATSEDTEGYLIKAILL